MNAKRLWGAIVVAGLSFSAAGTVRERDVHAQGSAKPSDAPMTKKAIALSLPGITWGQSPKQVAEAVDHIIDDDYRPLYKDVQPGVKMRELDAQLAEEKNQFRRSRIDFGKLPTGVDATPLRGEF